MKIGFNDILNKSKQVVFSKIITPVPSELKEQFDNLILKNSILRIKILCIALTVFRLIYYVFYHNSHSIPYTPEFIYYSETYLLFFLTFLFLVFTRYFLKKNKTKNLWFMCYLFMAFYIVYAMLNMIFIQADSTFIFQFLVAIFLSLFIPEFKPKIFIISAFLFYFFSVAILVFRNNGFNFEGIQEYIFFLFVAVMAIKLIQYNSKDRAKSAVFKLPKTPRLSPPVSVIPRLMRNPLSFAKI